MKDILFGMVSLYIENEYFKGFHRTRKWAGKSILWWLFQNPNVRRIKHTTRKILTLLIDYIHAANCIYGIMGKECIYCECIGVFGTYVRCKQNDWMRDLLFVFVMYRLGMRIVDCTQCIFPVCKVHDFIRASNVWRPNNCTSMILGSQWVGMIVIHAAATTTNPYVDIFILFHGNFRVGYAQYYVWYSVDRILFCMLYPPYWI